MTRVRVPLYRELLEGITFQSVHHEKGRRELWWDSLYSYIGLYFMKSPKRAFEKARSRNCQVWKHMLPRLLISFTVAFFHEEHLKMLSVQSAMSIISYCSWKCQYQVGVSYPWKFLILHAYISYLWSHTQRTCSYCLLLHTHTVLSLLYPSIGVRWWSE